jgi:uncharacterized protein (UPF0335 family)
MPDVGGIAGERLRSLIERIERLEEEKRTLAADIKEVYAKAKGSGFDTKIMRQLIKIRRMDKDDLDEQEALLDVYKRALGMLADTPLGEAAIDRAETVAAATHARVDKIVGAFVDGVARHDGDSVSITTPGGGGVRIRNKGGRKTVERVAANGEAAAP